MASARLVKRQEVAQQEQSEQAQTAPAPSIATTVGVVKDWMHSRQAARRANPREAFAALFARAQAS